MPKPKNMVCKLQRSTYTTKGQDQVIIYNRERSFSYTGVLTDGIRAFMGKHFKMFVHCHIDGTELVIDRVAKWGNW